VLFTLLALVVVVWGGAFVAIRELVQHASVGSVALLRFLLTMVGLLIAMVVVRPHGPPLER
jgi:drug/metabolite transporter (DMT)-like permease